MIYDIQPPTAPTSFRVCVFCGSSSGARAIYARRARAPGRGVCQRGVGLVYGGSNRGLMGVVADTVSAGGGEVIGVIPEHLLEGVVANSTRGELRVVSSMHQRKALMADLADAFIAMPGGFGTLDEFFEIITWAQLGLHARPIGFLNVAGYFDRFNALVDHAVAEGFVDPLHPRLLIMCDEPATPLDALLSHSMSPVGPVRSRRGRVPLLR